jgi:hypothetical protein
MVKVAVALASSYQAGGGCRDAAWVIVHHHPHFRGIVLLLAHLMAVPAALGETRFER